MGKLYWGVYALNIAEPELGWFHEASRDTRMDAEDDNYSLRYSGHKVKLIRDDGTMRTILVNLARLNGEIE